MIIRNNLSQFNFEEIDFSGSLDTLCNLIRFKRLDIHKLDITELTDQYLEFINENIKKIAIDVLGEHLAMASYLVELKTRFSLPNNTNEEIKDLEKQRDDLFNRLIEHNAYKNMAEKLKEAKLFRETMFDLPQHDYDQFTTKELEYKPIPEYIDPMDLKNLMDKIIYDFEQANFEIIPIQANEYDTSLILLIIKKYLESKENKTGTLIDFFNSRSLEYKNRQFLAICFLIILVMNNQNILDLKLENNDLKMTLNQNNKIEYELNETLELLKQQTNEIAQTAIEKFNNGDKYE